MQRLTANRLTKVLRLGLLAALLVCSAMVTVPWAHGQQDVDPTQYDYRPEANKTTQPSTPAASTKSKQQKNRSASRHQAGNKTRANKQTSNDNPHVATASAK